MEEIRPILNDQQFQTLQMSVTQALTQEWLRTKDLPGYLNMADSTIRVNLPGLPFHIIGGIKLYSIEEINKYIKNNF